MIGEHPALSPEDVAMISRQRAGTPLLFAQSRPIPPEMADLLSAGLSWAFPTGDVVL